MAFGLSFGKKSKTTTTNTSVDKLTATNSQQSQVQQQSTTANQVASQAGQSASSGASSTSGTSRQDTNQQQQTNQVQQQTAFGEGVLTDLESSVQSLLGGIGTGTARDATQAALAGLGGFDAEAYVNGIVTNARNRSETDRATAIATAENAIGGTVNSNSAAALLASRVNNDAEANLAGIESDAVAKAQAILANNVQAGVQGQTVDNQLLTQLADILKGGRSTGETSGVASTTGAATTAQAQDTQTNESNVTAQQSQQQSQTDVLSQLLTILQGTERTKGTETSRAKETSGGFGISI